MSALCLGPPRGGGMWGGALTVGAHVGMMSCGIVGVCWVCWQQCTQPVPARVRTLGNKEALIKFVSVAVCAHTCACAVHFRYGC